MCKRSLKFLAFSVLFFRNSLNSRFFQGSMFFSNPEKKTTSQKQFSKHKSSTFKWTNHKTTSRKSCTRSTSCCRRRNRRRTSARAPLPPGCSAAPSPWRDSCRPSPARSSGCNLKFDWIKIMYHTGITTFWGKLVGQCDLVVIYRETL